MLKKTSIVLMLMAVALLAGCSGPKAVTVGGSSDGDSVLSVGSVIPGKAEVGFTAVGFNGPDKTDYALGPYAVYLIPTPDAISDDWQPFTGGAMLIDEDFEFIPKIVAGVIYKPYDNLSPVYFAEKAFPSGSVDSVNIGGRSDDIYHWFALRYRW